MYGIVELRHKEMYGIIVLRKRVYYPMSCYICIESIRDPLVFETY